MINSRLLIGQTKKIFPPFLIKLATLHRPTIRHVEYCTICRKFSLNVDFILFSIIPFNE